MNVDVLELNPMDLNSSICNIRAMRRNKKSGQKNILMQHAPSNQS